MSKPRLLLNVNSISKNYDKKKILDDISFKLYENEILAIAGYSGVGKTTLLNIICGVELQDSGKIECNNKNKLGYSSQKHSFYEELTIEENLQYFSTLYGFSKDEVKKRIEELLEKFDLEQAKKVKGESLSEGQKKRLDIACALINHPRIVIFDEPTANLDFKLRKDLLHYIKQIKQEGVSILFVSHILGEIEEVADRVMILNDSKITKLKSSKGLKKQFDNLEK